MKSNVGRVMTIRFTIQTDEYPEWLNSIKSQEPVNGVVISAIAVGDMFEELDDALKVIKNDSSDEAEEFREKYGY